MKKTHIIAGKLPTSSGEGAGVGCSEDMPVVEWSQLGKKMEIGRGGFAIVYRAIMTQPGGEEVTVALKVGLESLPDSLKKRLNLQKEARALQRLAGVAGVPKLYGLTRSPPEALVMSLCSGDLLGNIMAHGDVRTFVTAILHTCTTVMNMHAKGVFHNDLHDENILVERTASGEVQSVSILDFGLSEIDPEIPDEATDAWRLSQYVFPLLDIMTETSDSDLNRKRDQFYRIVSEVLSVKQISALFCSILHGHKDGDQCTSCPSSAF